MTVLHPVSDDEPRADPTPSPPERSHSLTASIPEPGGWLAPELVDESTRRYWVRVTGAVTLLLGITVADLILIKTTFNLILRDIEALSWILGASLTGAAVVLPLTAGSYARRAHAHRGLSRAEKLLTTALVVGWAVLGVGMFVLRWNAADFAPTAVQYEGGGLTDGGTEAARERLLAGVVATVYLATGILAFVDGYKLTNPVAAALRATRNRPERLRTALHDQEALVARLRENLEAATHEYCMLPADRATAVAAREALAGELKALARVQIALHLADPAATGVVRPSACPPLPELDTDPEPDADPDPDPDADASPVPRTH